MAARSSPMTRVRIRIPEVPSTRLSPREKRSEIQTTICVPMIAAVTETHPAAPPPVASTATMAATIAPGPASRGVPKGTRAALEVTASGSGLSSALSVSSSRATRRRSNPPATWREGTEMPRNFRM